LSSISKTITLVPLIVPDITNPFFAQLAKTMTAAAGERGYQVAFCVTENDAGAALKYLHAMRAMYAPYGVIATYAGLDPAEFEPLGFGSRLVVHDRVDASHHVPTVTVDSVKGIELAFDHLCAWDTCLSDTFRESPIPTPKRLSVSPSHSH
jgi:DNA-binding LacI/PurR family transcriptional regulator